LTSYKEKILSGREQDITSEETMAFIEDEYKKAKELIYEATTGKVPQSQDFEILEVFAGIKTELEDRRRNCSFGIFLEAEMTKASNREEGLRYPVTKDKLGKLFEDLYCGVDTAVNAPLSVMLSLTKQQQKDRYEIAPEHKAPVKLLEQLFLKYRVPDSMVEIIDSYKVLQGQQEYIESIV